MRACWRGVAEISQCTLEESLSRSTKMDIEPKHGATDEVMPVTARMKRKYAENFKVNAAFGVMQVPDHSGDNRHAPPVSESSVF